MKFSLSLFSLDKLGEVYGCGGKLFDWANTATAFAQRYSATLTHAVNIAQHIFVCSASCLLHVIDLCLYNMSIHRYCDRSILSIVEYPKRSIHRYLRMSMIRAVTLECRSFLTRGEGGSCIRCAFASASFASASACIDARLHVCTLSRVHHYMCMSILCFGT